MHPGIASDTRDNGSVSTKKTVNGATTATSGATSSTDGGGGAVATGVLAFHGWEKGSPIIASHGHGCSDSDDDDDDQKSVLNCIKMECSSSSRDSTSTSPFIEHYKLPEMDFSSSSSSSESDDDNLNHHHEQSSSEHPSFTDPSLEASQIEPEQQQQTTVAPEPPVLIKQEPTQQQQAAAATTTTENVQRRKKAIYRRHESQTELDGRKARMALALKRRQAALDELHLAELNDTEHNVLSSTALAFSGDRHGTFVGRPRSV